VRQGRRHGGVAAGLAEKYRRLAALRRSLGGAPPDAAQRSELRALAAAWPGALRELDSLDTDEIDRRAAACAAAACGDGHEEPWMAWIARYHELMWAALALRRGVPAQEAGVDEDFARAVGRPQHGRLNVTVFARLAAEADIPVRTLWDALFPRRGKSARHYRG
jgi:hypothetical protein